MNSPPRIMVIDDDHEMQSMLSDFWQSQGLQVETHSSADAALAALNASPGHIDLIVSDINMPGASGLEMVEICTRKHPDIPVILITAFGSIESAVEAMRRGAFDYMVKPFKLTEVQVKAERALHYLRLRRDNEILRGEMRRPWSLDQLIGKSPVMQELFDLIPRVAHARAHVLISGESGTGKETIARAIHNLGERRDKPFITVDCTAIPESLLETELFGNADEGTAGQSGLFADANGGTLFLDEIGDMDLQLQGRLLRVLQERTIYQAGPGTRREVDVRVIAASHKDLKEAVRQEQFREDLYFRLSVIPIVVPPLRHRREDIPAMAGHFLTRFAALNGSDAEGFTSAALKTLVNAPWPGNVRELETVVERCAVLARGRMIDRDQLPELEPCTAEEFFGAAVQDFPSLADLERRYIRLVLTKTGGRKERASQILGINRRTLYRKEREYGFADAGPADGHDHLTEQNLST